LGAGKLKFWEAEQLEFWKAEKVESRDRVVLIYGRISSKID
jgi:hypothetical protein